MRTRNPQNLRINANCVVGMKPLSERDENNLFNLFKNFNNSTVGMKPLSERDENFVVKHIY